MNANKTKITLRFKTLLLLVLLLSSVKASTAQCSSYRMKMIDSLGNARVAAKAYFLKTKTDTIFLKQQEDTILRNLIGTFPRHEVPSAYALKYCLHCLEESIEIVDSIDINQDGSKEIFLLRQWECGASPPDMGPYGERGQRLSFSQYEVWDLATKQQLIEMMNSIYQQVAITTSVVMSRGYLIDVKISPSGSLILSNFNGDRIRNVPELGTYSYFLETKSFRKE